LKEREEIHVGNVANNVKGAPLPSVAPDGMPIGDGRQCSRKHLSANKRLGGAWRRQRDLPGAGATPQSVGYGWRSIQPNN